MAYIPIALAGGTHRHTDLSLTAQRTINFFPQHQESGSEKSPFVLESFYGLKSFASGTGLDRGMFEHDNILYKLSGTVLYSVDSSGTHTTLGSVPGDSIAVFEGIGTSLVVTADGVAYEWNGSSLVAGTDPDFENPNTVTGINNQAIYDGGGTNGRFAISDVGLPLNINALNYGTAESKSDFLIRPYAMGTTVFMFGSKTIEQWWNNGTGNPPLQRIEGGTIEVGLGARNSIANDDEFIYFLADDNQLYYLNGTVPTPLLPLTIVREIRKFTIKSDAIGWTMQIDGQWFYVLKFPSADRTFIYPKGIRRDVRGEAFELSSGVSGGRYLGNSYAFAYGKHLVADEIGNILELDEDTYTENGSVIRRSRTFAPVHGGLFGRPGKEVEVSFLRLIGATGKGSSASTSIDPKVILQYSQDGENFSTEIQGSVGKLGVKTTVEFEIGQSFETWVFRIISTDPNYSNWHSAAIEAQIGI
jgi:hypothetical protein